MPALLPVSHSLFGPFLHFSLCAIVAVLIRALVSSEPGAQASLSVGLNISSRTV